MTLRVIDPDLLDLVADQRQFLGGFSGHPGGLPPADPSILLPASELVIRGRAGEVRLRVLRPERVTGVYLHMHAGGFAFGAAAMADRFNSLLARALNIASVSVEYRLVCAAAPFPACLDDCVDAATWLMDHASSRFGTDRLLIGGESAGATLAVLTLLRLRDGGRSLGAFKAANLAVGNYDLSGTPSQRLAPASFFLSPEALARMRASVFPGHDETALRDPAVSPLYADLHGLPAAIFSVGTADSMLDDSMFMAARWQAAGNDSELHVYPESPHIFTDLPTKMAAEAERRIATFLSRHLHPAL